MCSLAQGATGRAGDRGAKGERVSSKAAFMTQTAKCNGGKSLLKGKLLTQINAWCDQVCSLLQHPHGSARIWWEKMKAGIYSALCRQLCRVRDDFWPCFSSLCTDGALLVATAHLSTVANRAGPFKTAAHWFLKETVSSLTQGVFTDLHLAQHL